MATIGTITAALTLSTKGFNTGIKKSVAGLGALRSGVSATTDAVFSLKSALVGLAGTLAVADIVKTGMEFQSLSVSMKAATGSAEAGAAAMAFVRAESNRLGLNLESTAQSMTAFLAAAKTSALTGQEQIQIFRGVSEAVTVMGLSSEQARGTFIALEQMISKGVVSSEELKQQLGERIPGAFSIAAKSIGKTEAEFTKLLETGKIIAADFLPKFASELQHRFAKDVPDAAQTARANFERLGNSITELKIAIANSGLLDFLSQLSKTFVVVFAAIGNIIKREFGDSLKDSASDSEDFTNSVTAGIRHVITAVGYLADAWHGIKIVVKGVEVSYLALKSVTLDVINSLVSGLRTFINRAISDINTLIDGINVIGSAFGKTFDKIEHVKFGQVLKREAITAQNELIEARASLMDLVEADKPSKGIEKFGDTFVAEMSKVKSTTKDSTDTISKLVEELNKAKGTTQGAAKGFTINISALEKDVAKGVGSAMSSSIENALKTGDYSALTTNIAESVAVGAAQGLGAQGGAAIAGPIGAAVGGGIAAGLAGSIFAKGSKISIDEIAKNKFDGLIAALDKNTQVLELQGLGGTAAAKELQDITTKIRETQSAISIGEKAKKIVGTGGAVDLAEGIALDKKTMEELGLNFREAATAAQTLSVNEALLTKLQDERSIILLENSQKFEQSGIALAGLNDQLGNASVKTAFAKSAWKRLGLEVGDTKAFKGLIKTASIAANKLADSSKTFDDLTTVEQDALIVTTDFADEVSLLGSVINDQMQAAKDAGTSIDNLNGVLTGTEYAAMTAKDAISAMESKLSGLDKTFGTVSGAVGSMAGALNETQQAIDKITQATLTPEKTVEYLGGRRVEAKETLATEQMKLGTLKVTDINFAEQVAKVAQANSEFLRLSTSASDAIASAFGSSDIGLAKQETILGDLRANQAAFQDVTEALVAKQVEIQAQQLDVQNKILAVMESQDAKLGTVAANTTSAAKSPNNLISKKALTKSASQAAGKTIGLKAETSTWAGY